MTRLLSSLCLAACLASAQPLSLRPEVHQAIGLYYQAKTDLAKAGPDPAAIAAARDQHDAMISSLTAKDQLAISLAHYFTIKAASIAQLERSDRALVRSFLTRRRNLQAGESAATGGSTALTSLANATEWISAAFESGALAKESKGTVTTLRVSGYGVYSWLAPQHERPCALSNPYCDSTQETLLRGLSGSVSIDNSTPSQTTTQPAQSNVTPSPVLRFLGSGGRITSATARLQFLQRVTPATKTEIDEWRKNLKSVEAEAGNFSLALQTIEKKIKSDAFAGWRKKVRTNAESLNQPEFERQYARDIETFFNANKTDLGDLDQLQKARSLFHSKLASALSASIFKPAATLEYVYASPAGQQSTSGIRFVIDKKVFAAPAGGDASNDVDNDHNGTVTANVALNWYNDIPQGITTGRMRDVQISGQFERAIGPATRKLRSSVSFAGYYQYQVNPAILTFDQNAVTPGPSQIPIPQPAAAALDSKGHIGIVQGKLTLRLTDSISIPLAVSWANRTELIKASTVKGQFGINIDLGSLLAK